MIFGIPLLSSILWLPLLGALLLAVLPSSSKGNEDHHTDGGRVLRLFAFLVTGLAFALSLCLFVRFDPTSSAYQFSEQVHWLPVLGVHYALGVDGISLFLVLLTTFLMPIIVMASHSIHSGLKGYLISMLLLETAMLGTLMSLDLFLFYVFWEFMLAPMYYIIGIWGGKRRVYAALKFVLYTAFGSVLMLVALIYLVASSAGTSFLLSDLLNVQFTMNEQIWLFAAFILAFGIKVPLFPFHTWLPDAHVEAPTGGSVVLAGVLLKMGIYGMFRFAYPLFPEAAAVFAPFLAALAVIGIIYGALVAWVQTDMKKLVAYSSVSHLGYCVLGLVAMTEVSATGSIYQMLNHGVSTGALFLLVGVLYDRTHSRLIADYGGLAGKLPVFAFLFLVFTLSSIALPLTNGFVGEFMILSGSFITLPGYAMLALAGVVLGAVYMLTLYLKTMFGELNEKKNGGLKDCTRLEVMTFAPLLILVVVMGVYPQPFLDRIQPAVRQFVSTYQQRLDSTEIVFSDGSLGQDNQTEDGIDTNSVEENVEENDAENSSVEEGNSDEGARGLEPKGAELTQQSGSVGSVSGV